MRTLKSVLLVEDDDVDAMTVKRAFSDLKITNPLVRKLNGEEALDYLRNEANPLPCVILLDLNMPKMNGIEFLKIAKADDGLRRIPVIVLTTSKSDEDRVESFGLSVAGYMIKPTDYKKFVDTIRIIDLYWTISELPNGSDWARDAKPEVSAVGQI
jgi:CheY-like chemotaxis protein